MLKLIFNSYNNLASMFVCIALNGVALNWFFDIKLPDGEGVLKRV